MEKLIQFCIDYYIILDIIIVFLILALIGYFVNIKKSKGEVYKLNTDDDNKFSVEGINTNMSLQDFVNENKIGANKN